MADVNWQEVWNDTLNKGSNRLKIKKQNDSKSSILLACPTQFSASGRFDVNITPSFNDDNITLTMLTFNDNFTLDDLNLKNIDTNKLNALADPIANYEKDNKISNTYTIESEKVDSHDDAVQVLIDYLFNVAQENGEMFDDKLDTLTAELTSKENNESLKRIINSIKANRNHIMKKVESMLSKYNWKHMKNESMNDSVTSFYDKNNNLAAVVSLVDNYILVDLAKNITAKVSMLQSDEEIEDELTNDIDAAQDILADRELNAMKDAVANNSEQPTSDELEYMESLSRRLTKLESLYIKKYLRKIY